jgi:AAA15 family ATPase/GTPase
MLERLKLRNFKSFREASVPLGPLTLVVGTNASGKSNLRDALRFLHGIGQGAGWLEDAALFSEPEPAAESG